MKSKSFEARVGALRFVHAALLLAALMLGALLAGYPAPARAGNADAAAVGNAGIGSCSSSTGKVLYDCLAGVLDRMAGAAPRAPETQSALQTAASRLRVATTKAQALSAIAACRSAIGGIIQRLRSGDSESVALNAITGVLATAARLIQAKG